MEQKSTAIIKQFFEDFEQASNTFDPEILAAQFSDPLVAADPHGRIQVAKRDDFLAGIAKRQAFFQSIGFQFVKISLLDETRLDDHYVMAKICAQMRFEKNPGKLIDLTSNTTYILFIKDNLPRVVFHTTHDDLMKVMREHDLLP